jgi:uncharacterized protein
MTARVVVIAKAPIAGRSKTRLCPPLSHELAARVAEASLAETLATVAVLGGRPVLVLDGEPGSWLPAGFEVVPQRGVGLDRRLAAALYDVGGPALLIGMDTPQVTPGLVRDGLDQLDAGSCDAVLGLALDGGWWAMGLRHPHPRAVVGVPMSAPFTGRMQRARLAELGLRVGRLPALRDVDTIHDAVAVARTIPGSRFAAVVRGALRAARELEPVA